MATDVMPGRKARRRTRREQAKSPAAERLVYSVPEAGRLLGLSWNGAYDAARRGDFPMICIGRRLLVPKGPFHQLIENGRTKPLQESGDNPGRSQPRGAHKEGEL